MLYHRANSPDPNPGSDPASQPWWDQLRADHRRIALLRDRELQWLDWMRAELPSPLPDWAAKTLAAFPDWGFEICSHRWLQGLEELVSMIADARYFQSPAGRCGDVPEVVRHDALALADAVEAWLIGAPPSHAGSLEHAAAASLGPHSDDKRQAAWCFVELVRAAFEEGNARLDELSRHWRVQANDNAVLARIFYGEGLDGGLKSRCGYGTLPRLHNVLRIIGGDDSALQDLRWFCNMQLRHVLQDDPARVRATLGCLWGLYTYLSRLPESWLWEEHGECAGQASRIFMTLARGGRQDPLKRFLAASLLSSAKFWYERMVNFTGRWDVPLGLQQVPLISLELLGITAPTPEEAWTD